MSTGISGKQKGGQRKAHFVRKPPTKSRVPSDSKNAPVIGTGKMLALASFAARAASRFVVDVRPGVRSEVDAADATKAMLASIGCWSRVRRPGKRLAIWLGSGSCQLSSDRQAH